MSKRLFFFLPILILCGCAVFAWKSASVTECVSVLRYGTGTSRWEALGVGAGDQAAAARWEGEQLLILPFSPEGSAAKPWSAPLPEEYRGGTVAALYPVGDTRAFVGLYTPDAGRLALFRLAKGEDPACLLTEPCPGTTSAQREEAVRLSGFCTEDGLVSFALILPGELRSYVCREDAGGLEALGETACETLPLRSCVILRDGTAALGGDGFFSVGGDESWSAPEQMTVTQLLRGRYGWYFVDAMTLTVCFEGSARGGIQRLFSLEGAIGSRSLSSLALTRGENALLLLGGVTLLRAGINGVTELSGILAPAPGRCAGTLTLYALMALLGAAVLWYLLCGVRRGYTPLAVYGGGTLLAMAAMVALLLQYGFLDRETDAAALDMNRRMISAAVSSLETERAEAAALRRLCLLLEGGNGSGYQNVRAAAAERTEDGWVLTDGSRAAYSPVFWKALAEAAEGNRSACAMEGETLRFACPLGDRVLCLSLGDSFTVKRLPVELAILLGLALYTAVALLLLASVGKNLRRLARQMELLSNAGGTGRTLPRLQMRTGDELESMSSAIDSLAGFQERQGGRRLALERSYRRFVPEKVLSLLGKDSIEELSKDSFAVRRMAVMAVSFRFPEQLYTKISNSRLLFDSVNDVIERTAAIAAKKGGTVFNFAYNGYDVVMESDNRQVISTAVAIQQEVLSFNEIRTASGLPTVKLSIALDVGDVMLGIVGDDNQMQPVTISSGFSVAREFIGLCRRLDARILCTEEVISGAQEVGSRYMGKCVVGETVVRVYEVFEGDEYLLRQAKAGTVRAFTHAVLELYSGGAGTAKREFLQLAHSIPNDGGARWYLYLSDRLEQYPDLACSLNATVDRERSETAWA